MNPISQAARTGQELLEASGDVIARRLEILAEAARDPLNADLVEINRMGAEKAVAMGAAAGAGLKGAADLAARTSALVARETETARQALDAVAHARTPVEAMLTQSAWATAAAGRALETGWTFGAALMQAQADIWAPIHTAATENAKRLRKR